jgi:hypothetical protein
MSLNPDAPRCPQCTHPVIVNRADCRGCGRPYHELCLKRGCTNGPTCGSASAVAAGGPGKWLALPFLAATIGLGAAYFKFGPKVTGSTWFGPALGTGLVGMVAALKIGDSPPAGAKCRAGRFAGWLLLVAAFGAGAIAGTGREVPYTAHLTALGAAGGVLAALGLVFFDRDKRPSVLHVLLAAHLYFVAAVILSPGFPRTMLARLQQGGAAAAGPGAGAGPSGGGGGLGSLLGISSGGADVQIKGVMKVGGRMQAMTQSGSFSVGDTVPGAGTVHSINDVEVVIKSPGGQLQKYAVPH